MWPPHPAMPRSWPWGVGLGLGRHAPEQAIAVSELAVTYRQNTESAYVARLREARR